MPDHVAADLAGLRAAPDDQVVSRTEDNLLIGTWNIRALGGYTNRRTAGAGGSPKRDWHAMSGIAEVIRRFDVTAIQETRRGTRALFAILSLLGEDYRVIASDVTEGTQGNDERLAFITTAPRFSPRGWSGRSCCPRRPRERSSSWRARRMPPDSCAAAWSSS